jgi:hypothetical protein
MELACTLPAAACCMQTFATWLCAGWTHVCRISDTQDNNTMHERARFILLSFADSAQTQPWTHPQQPPDYLYSGSLHLQVQLPP